VKKALLFLIIFSILFTTGCWDMVEINERIYPYAVGIDVNNAESSEGDSYMVTFSYPNIFSMGENATQEETIYAVLSTGSSLFDAAQNLTSNLQYPIYNKHLKVLVLSDAVARNPKNVLGIIDGLNRDYVINKMIQLVVTPKTAEELIFGKLKAKRQRTTEGVLYSILINRQNTSMFTPKTLANFIDDMDRTGVSTLPMASMVEDYVDIAGAGIFKNYQLIGYIDAKENEGIAMLNNRIRATGIDATYNGTDLSILATNIKTKKKLIDAENLKVEFLVKIEGQVHEFTLPQGNYTGIDTEEMLHDMEEAVENEVKMNIVNTLEILQKEYQADAIYLSDYLEKYHPNVWEQVKDNWDEVFLEAELEVDVEVVIERRGLTK
jgi:Ger(x)C family germination protein